MCCWNGECRMLHHSNIFFIIFQITWSQINLLKVMKLKANREENNTLLGSSQQAYEEEHNN